MRNLRPRLLVSLMAIALVGGVAGCSPVGTDQEDLGTLEDFTLGYGSTWGIQVFHVYKVQPPGSAQDQYEVRFTAQGYYGDDTAVDTMVDPGVLSDLESLIDTYEIATWDGFDESNEDIEDGFDFTLEAVFTNATINAHGYEEFPPGARPGLEALARYLENLVAAHTDPGSLKEFSYRFGSFNSEDWTFHVLSTPDPVAGGVQVRFTAQGRNFANLDVDAIVESSVLVDLDQIIRANNITWWNGFDQSNPDVMDGWDFRLEAVYSDVTITARGYMEFPRNFHPGHDALETYLKDLAYACQ